ncbi:AAA family ATPase [Umezawaea sp. NPDC059074]|uniref:AAA family ATPase n=1 Tax=Umezawaea sp. NPDC059074 TaxID=3346716 RepID=UPI0036CD7BB9
MHSSPTPAEAYGAIAANVQRVILGKPEVVRLAVVALFAEGHLLIEDKPGLGKTTLARCLAASVRGRWSRIQFTPDLLPSDITGASVYHQGSESFEFHHGAIFANVVLADEINRATPKTQSALLEVMAERAVTVEGTRYEVPRPFMVVGTQNPIELQGTYRLPEAQLDRFLMRVSVGYPDHDTEVQVLLGDHGGITPEQLPAVIDLPTLERVIADVRAVKTHPEVCSYAVRIAAASRAHSDVLYGASPRGSLALLRAARAWAATDNRGWVTPDDVNDVAHAVLEHRVILSPEAELGRRTARDVVIQIVESTPAPVSRA